MHIGILQCGPVPPELLPHTGTYSDMFQRLLAGRGFSFSTWNIYEMDFPHSIDVADGFLITGSRYGVYEDHPWLPPLEQTIKAIYLAPKPMVGVCFGHQIIAKALGGVVEKSAKGWGVGRMEYQWGDETRALNAWHQDQVITPPAGAQTVARNRFCEHAALLYGDRAFTVQAHPEFGREVMQGLINLRGDTVPEARLAYAQSALDQPVDTARLAQDFEAFFKAPRAWQTSSPEETPA